MISTYRRVLGLPGALAFSSSGLVGRLPISMVSLGIVLLVTSRTGSYALAGSISASYLIANAVFAVLQARLVDRLGQSRVLPWTINVFAGGLIAMMIAIESGADAPIPHLFAVVSGAALPQVGSCVRARWSYIVEDKQNLQTAFAIEAVADEAVFMLGPTLVTLLATLVDPVAGLWAAVVSGLAGTLLLSAQRRTEPPPAPRQLRRRQGGRSLPLGWAVLGPLTFCSFTLGVLFGAAEVSTVAFSEELGHKSYAGPLLAIWALGSLLSGLITGALHLKTPSAQRFRWGLLILALLMTPLPFVDSFVVMAMLLFLAGFAISPTLIASVAWVEATVPVSRLTEGIAIITTGLGAGIAPGAAIVGIVIDNHGASTSYWVAALAGLLGAVVAFGAARLRPGAATPSPSGSSV